MSYFPALQAIQHRFNFVCGESGSKDLQLWVVLGKRLIGEDGNETIGDVGDF